jgi:hypothetical protein
MLIHPYQFNIGQTVTYQDIDFYYSKIPSNIQIFVGYIHHDIQHCLSSTSLSSSTSAVILRICQIITSYLFPQLQVQSYEFISSSTVSNENFSVHHGLLLTTNSVQKIQYNNQSQSENILNLPSYSLVYFNPTDDSITTQTTFSLLLSSCKTTHLLIHFN